MSAVAITDVIIVDIENHHPNFICLNFANADMVGHTGVFEACVKAVETVDTCIGRLLACGIQHDYEILIIADHGNSDYMINEDGTPNTAHTMNPVPCVYIGKSGTKLSFGNLADIAPTILGLFGIELPLEMNGTNLLY